MELNNDQILQLKKVELGILLEFISVCSKINLKYYLIGGTLIGAVRHKGFIPWDDDIDVIMPRRDYDIFMKKAQSHLPDNLFIQTIDTDSEYPNCFAKIRNTSTTFIEESIKSRIMNHGIYIDIFPLDYYPESFIKRKWVDAKDFMLKIAISRLYDSKASYKIKILQQLSRLFYHSPEKAIEQRNTFLSNLPKSRYVRNYCGAWGKREIWLDSWFADGSTVTFEHESMCAPSNFHEVLSKVYGDYMTLPPEDKRIAHHYCEIFDSTTSFEVYLK